MKLFIYNLFAIVFISLHSQATIRRCNNNPGVTGTYQTLSDAMLASSSGDTIHLEPSPVSYGQVGGFSNPFVSVYNLTIIGNGLDLAEHPGLQSDTLRSTIDYFSSSGDYNRFYGINCTGAMFIFGDHNTLENCRFKFLRFYSHNNKLSHCNLPMNLDNVFTEGKFGSLYFSYNAHDIEISNSFIGGHIEVDSNTAYNLTFLNNTFYDSMLNFTPQVSKFYNSTLINNIFKSNASILDTSGNNIFINNVATSNSFVLPTSNGNVSGVNPYTMFANPYSKIDSDQQLLPSFTPQQVGMFAGIDPYIPGKLPPVPSIYQLNVPLVIQSNTSQITISTRSNK